MNANHTPKPYGIGPLTQGGPEKHDLHIPIVAGSTVRIADVYARQSTHPEISPAEAMANARLFKAAPKLLTACQAALRHLTTDYEQVGKDRNCSPVYLEVSTRVIVRDALRTAIEEAQP